MKRQNSILREMDWYIGTVIFILILGGMAAVKSQPQHDGHNSVSGLGYFKDIDIG